jgi:hypothetical protein
MNGVAAVKLFSLVVGSNSSKWYRRKWNHVSNNPEDRKSTLVATDKVTSC